MNHLVESLWGRRIRRALGTAVVAGTVVVGMVGVGAGGAGASVVAAPLYAYSSGGATAPASCPQTTDVSNQCTLTQALTLVFPGQQILLADSNTVDGNFTVDTAGTSASSRVTIAPAPRVTGANISAQFSGTVFTIAPGDFVTLKNFAIDQGSAAANGGGIDNGGTLSMTGMEMDSNTAKGNGADIYNENGAALTVANSTLFGDFAAGNGGIIDSADGSGNTGTVTVTNSTLSEGGANDGGLIDSGDNGGTGTLTVAGSTFSYSNAADGAAIDNGDNEGSGTLNVTNTKFLSNGFVGSGNDGGAIDNGDHNGQGNATISGSQFASDAVQGMGGAIDSGDNGAFSISTCSQLTLTDTTFTGDSSTYAYGGAIANGADAGCSVLSITSGTFTGNTASNNGGGAIANGVNEGLGIATLNVSTFSHDSAFSGGAIDSADFGEGLLIVKSTKFTGEKASSNGGAIDSGDNGGGGNLNAVASTFATNSAGAAGGAIYSGMSASMGHDTFSHNSAVNGGAIGNAANLALSAVTFANNKASANGGALDNLDNSNAAAAVRVSTFTANTASGNGSALYNAGAGTLSVVDSTIDGNSGTTTVDSVGGTTTLAGSIVAASSGTNCAGSVTDAGFNLEDDGGASCGFTSGSHDLVGINPALGPLASNGGQTQTMAPSSTSPVLDQIPNPTTVSINGSNSTICPQADQRDVSPPSPAIYGCAIGSVDFANTTLPIVGSLQPNTGRSAGGNTVVITGVNFTSGSTVAFGSNASPTVTYVSPTTLDAVAPAGTPLSSVQVTVTASSQTSPYRPKAQYAYKT